LLIGSMSSSQNLRHQAAADANAVFTSYFNRDKRPASQYFGELVFGEAAMRQFLTEEVYDALLASNERTNRLDAAVAEQVAAGMKAWAVEQGATHYTHWFQPLTGATAEKHDAFFTLTPDGRTMEKFSGSALVQQEPDASSFPSGGIRNTFEARGYTAWDPSSPAFLYEAAGGKTLCIPTIFVSYTGESLDYKSPLLKSLALLEAAAVEVCQLFDRNVTKVTPTLGIEQEYFLVDERLFALRPDLLLAGRTLLGHMPARGQQLEDHYFGSISERVLEFMGELEQEAHRLGIPLKTRHNEVAPGQFECAPTFEEINLAVDHNQLLMDLMDRTARHHGLRVILHEKPFKGVNGSGKHNNWSLSTNTGKNLLSPGKTPKNNLQFLTFFVNVIQAFDEAAPLIRASIASAANDHRLGANEAPPAVMSVFLGEHLSKVLDEIESSDFSGVEADGKSLLRLGIAKIPEILLDNTDRNRTSPMAFTGNKFELRAVGSSANSASAMTVLNTAVAVRLRAFMDAVSERIAGGENRDKAILELLRESIRASKQIRFEGNGYAQEWLDEAAKRGLPNAINTPQALAAITAPASHKLFIENGIYTERELQARQEIQYEIYLKKVQIEARVLGEMCMTQVVPVAVEYQKSLSDSVIAQRNLLDLGTKSHVEPLLEVYREVVLHTNKVIELVHEMIEARKAANTLGHASDIAMAYADTVLPFFEQIRYHADKLELLIGDSEWPLPKYRELLFLR